MQMEQIEESDAYSMFVYAVRSQVTRDYYLRRLRIFFNHINLLPSRTMEERCNFFAEKALSHELFSRAEIPVQFSIC
jgi:hypothetical protein